jgi:hypothetical protein
MPSDVMSRATAVSGPVSAPFVGSASLGAWAAIFYLVSMVF